MAVAFFGSQGEISEIFVHKRYHSHSLLGTATVQKLQNGWRFAITIFFRQGKALRGALLSVRKALPMRYSLVSDLWSITHKESFKTQPQLPSADGPFMAEPKWILCRFQLHQVDKLLDLASAGAPVDQ